MVVKTLLRSILAVLRRKHTHTHSEVVQVGIGLISLEVSSVHPRGTECPLSSVSTWSLGVFLVFRV